MKLYPCFFPTRPILRQGVHTSRLDLNSHYAAPFINDERRQPVQAQQIVGIGLRFRKETGNDVKKTEIRS